MCALRLTTWQLTSFLSACPQLPEGVQGLLVEMNRSSGDPVLFVKPAAAGFRPGGLPSVLDYDNFTDSVSFRERLNSHSRLLQMPPPGP